MGEPVTNYLYTKNGVPLTVSGNQVYNPAGRQFGRISGSRVYGANGRYVGTIDGDRLVYRSIDSAMMEAAFTPFVSAPTAMARQTASAVWGDEPDIGS
jgi:hypothetical protein